VLKYCNQLANKYSRLHVPVYGSHITELFNPAIVCLEPDLAGQHGTAWVTFYSCFACWFSLWISGLLVSYLRCCTRWVVNSSHPLCVCVTDISSVCVGLENWTWYWEICLSELHFFHTRYEQSQDAILFWHRKAFGCQVCICLFNMCWNADAVTKVTKWNVSNNDVITSHFFVRMVVTRRAV
jgi:hypothetical protein